QTSSRVASPEIVAFDCGCLGKATRRKSQRVRKTEGKSTLNKMLGLKVNPQAETQSSIMRGESVGLGMLPQELFLKLLRLERRRTERSGRRFVLMLLEAGNLLKSAKTPVLANILLAVAQSTRDTDLKGWYKDGSVIGVIFTEVGDAEDKSIIHALSTKLTDSLHNTLSIREI